MDLIQDLRRADRGYYGTPEDYIYSLFSQVLLTNAHAYSRSLSKYSSIGEGCV